jgi:hypothetical protein
MANDTEAQMHLFQLRLVLFRVRERLGRGDGPNTAPSGLRVLRTSSKNHEMSRVRCGFIAKVYGFLESAIKESVQRKSRPPNRVGNYPGYTAFGILFDRQGNYRSLCLNIPIDIDGVCPQKLKFGCVFTRV